MSLIVAKGLHTTTDIMNYIMHASTMECHKIRLALEEHYRDPDEENKPILKFTDPEFIKHEVMGYDRRIYRDSED